MPSSEPDTFHSRGSWRSASQLVTMQYLLNTSARSFDSVSVTSYCDVAVFDT